MSLRHVSRLWVKVIQGLIINRKDHRSTTSNASIRPAVTATTHSISNSNSNSNSNSDFIPNSNSDSDYDNMRNVVEKESSSSSRSQEEKLRLMREAEKADIIMQLVCFGPNS
ncbi:hypothetical protein ACP275_13G027400 [Erythranthe tilingii]